MVNVTDLGFTPQELERAITEGQVTARRHPTLPLAIYSYSDEVHFAQHWTPVTTNCRGLILDLHYNVVARPWKKFYNLGDKNAEFPWDAPAEVTDKVDGSLGILWAHDDRFGMATKGSFSSTQAEAGEAIFAERYADSVNLSAAEQYTFLFEILLPWNRIVVNYFNGNSEYVSEDGRVLPEGSARNDSGEYLRPTQQRLENVSSLQVGGSEAGSSEESGEALREYESLGEGESGEGFGSEESLVSEDQSGNRGSQAGRALRRLWSSVSPGSNGLRSSTGAWSEEIQHRSEQELDSIGRGTGKVRDSVRELSSGQNARHQEGELVLLGAVHTHRGYYLGPNEAAAILGWTGPVTKVMQARSVKDALAAADRRNAEGVVIRSGNKMVKLKQSDYVELHRIISNLSEKTIWEQMVEGKSKAKIVAPLPDEWHAWANGVVEKISDAFAAKVLEIHNEFLAIPQGLDRKRFAMLVSDSPNRAYLFKMYDGKSIMDDVLKSLKPKGESPDANS